MRRNPRRALWVGGLLAASLSFAAAHGGPARLYKIEPQSTFQRGCFPPCLCPLLEAAALRGTFRLKLITVGDVFDFYEVSRIRWRAWRSNTEAIPITGAGFYKVSPIAKLQQMTVELVVGAEPAVSFDSADAALAAEFPRIDVTISINGGFCLDTVIEVRARPTMFVRLARTGLAWEDEPLDVAPWSIVRGDLGTLRSSGGDFAAATAECVARDYWGSTLPFELDPEPGKGFWFLAQRTGDTFADGGPEQVGDPDGGIAASSGACR